MLRDAAEVLGFVGIEPVEPDERVGAAIFVPDDPAGAIMRVLAGPGGGAGTGRGAKLGIVREDVEARAVDP